MLHLTLEGVKCRLYVDIYVSDVRMLVLPFLNKKFLNLEKPCHVPCIPQEIDVTSLFVRTEQGYTGLPLIPVLTADI